MQVFSSSLVVGPASLAAVSGSALIGASCSSAILFRHRREWGLPHGDVVEPIPRPYPAVLHGFGIGYLEAFGPSLAQCRPGVVAILGSPLRMPTGETGCHQAEPQNAEQRPRDEVAAMDRRNARFEPEWHALIRIRTPEVFPCAWCSTVDAAVNVHCLGNSETCLPKSKS